MERRARRISTPEEVKDSGEQHDEESLWGTGEDGEEVDDLLEDEEEESLMTMMIHSDKYERYHDDVEEGDEDQDMEEEGKMLLAKERN
jgi:hypothetical protein